MRTSIERTTGLQGRRDFLRAAGLGMAGIAGAGSWLTPVAEKLARAAEKSPSGAPVKSVIVLWLQGGPSQLETFDPHPNETTGGAEAIKTAVPEIEIAKYFPQLAEQMETISLVRSVTSKEGDHERASYNMRTGYRPDPTLIHPSLGAILCHQSPDNVEIPRHVSILYSQWPSRGGYLGDQFDALKVFDLNGQLPNVTSRVADPRFKQRISDLENVVESEFARGRMKGLDEKKTLHRTMINNAVRMMTSDQLKAFDVSQAPESQIKEFGDTQFGRGCIAATRLIHAGVRCVEVTLGSFDSHVRNHEIHADLAKSLDPAFAALMRHLKSEKLLEHTVVLCAGEFGRTPVINGVGGRDHWPHGFTVALAGGGIAGGRVIGETTPEPKINDKDRLAGIKDPHNVADIHATVLKALGIDGSKEIVTPIGRPMKLSDGEPITELLS